LLKKNKKYNFDKTNNIGNRRDLEYLSIATKIFKIATVGIEFYK